jgi:hypothetical protein
MSVPEVYLGDDKLLDPSWAEVKKRIEQLNGSSSTEVLIGDLDKKQFLIISGGNEGRYLGVVQEGKKGFYTLIDPEKPEELVMVKSGGLDDYYPANRVQSLQTVLRTAKTYFETSEKDVRFQWKKGQ